MSGPIINLADLSVPSRGLILDYLFFNVRFGLLVNAINQLALRQDSFDATENTLVQTGLDRVNQVLGPLLTQLQEAAQLGFLVGMATGVSQSLTTNTDVAFTITSAGQNLLTPTPYLLAADNNDQTNWGVLHFTSYVPATGALVGHCVYATKTQPSSSWTISCDSAVFPAMLNLLAQAQTAASSASANAASVAGSIATINSLVAAVQSGPVVSVAGHTGAVTLQESDIVGLVSDLATRVTTTTYNTGIAAKQNTAANLTALAALTLSANMLLMATGTGALTQTTVSALALTLLGNASAAAMQSTLGLGSAATQPSSAFAAAGSYAPLASPALTGTPTAPTPTTGDNTTKLATTAFVLANAAAQGLTLNAQAASYTLTATDMNKLVRFTAAGAVTLTLPNSLPVGFNCMVEQAGAGVIAFTAASGAVLNSRGGRVHSNGQYAVALLYVEANGSGTAANYILTGDIAT